MSVEQVEFTDAELKTIGQLASSVGQFDERQLISAMHRIARHEIASLAGLVLRRTSEEHLSRSPDRNIVDTQIRRQFAEIFGEVLADFSGHTGGEEPG